MAIFILLKMNHFLFVGLFIAIAARVLWLHKVYRYKFSPCGHFTNMLELDDEVDPWTEWTENDMLLTHLGRELASKTSLLMGCLVRDIEKEIPFVVKKLSTLSRTFQRIHVIFMENNSKDRTREIILNWCNKSMWPNISFVCVHPETFETNTEKCHLQNVSTIRHGICHSRISRMVYLRNRLNQYVCQWLKKNPSFQYVLYSDIDLHGIIYQRGLYHSFGCFHVDSSIQVIGFRGTTEKGWLWDSYAYESYNNFTNVAQLAMCKMSSGEVDISISDRLLRVSCSFSGGTFIRARDMSENFHYSVVSVGSLALCEHVPFYRNFEHIYINTNMIQTHTNFETRELSIISV